MEKARHDQSGEIEEELIRQNSGFAVSSAERSQNQLVGDSDPPLIEDHQIFNLVGVLNPFTHPPLRTEFNSEFWLLTPEFFLDKPE